MRVCVCVCGGREETIIYESQIEKIYVSINI
jgi:hypothetical protein